MSDPFIAEIRAFGFNFAPTGWAACDGQTLAISQNTALFSLIGTFYGGNGSTNFRLPDLQGRAALAHGNGPGLTPRSQGEVGGVESVTLVNAQMPAHGHAVNVAGGPGGQADRANASGNFLGVPADATYATGAAAAMSAGAIGASGGGQPHNNRQPYLALNFCIAMQGIYPPRT